MHEKIGIVVVNHNDFTPYANGGNGLVIGINDIKLQNEDAYAIIHELLHVAFLRNGVSMNGAFDEGFTTYYTAHIIEKDKRLNYTYDSYGSLGDYKFPINEDTAEQTYIVHEQGSGRYQLGFRLMHFIFEKVATHSRDFSRELVVTYVMQ